MTSASKGAIWRPDGAIFARDHPITGEIWLWRQVVSALRGRADLVIDTSLLTAADLKCSLIGHVAFDAVVCAILSRPLAIVGASRAIPS
jgi:hypothetical protein